MRKKLLFIGSPGSGKSTLAKRVSAKLNYPLLHLDVIYHIDNENHISREELMQKVYEFDLQNEKWIIDGNFGSTLEKRLELADTAVLLNLPAELCVKNAIERTKQKFRDDIAPGFDNTILDEEFLEFIREFPKQKLPEIRETMKKFEQSVKVIELKSYLEMDEFVDNLEEYLG